ncbi:MAG TPA: hypothetical protein VEX86_16875, partial [Longimicrobium sp.]|nr:hypothetical protein [Longimicrobium sp.]
MAGAPLPFPTEAELLAASGYPYLPVRVRHRAPLAWHPLRDGEEAARYTYVAADGTPRFECIRFHLRAGHPAAPDKAFLSRRVEAGGGAAWGLDDVELVPYRLDRVRAAVAAGERIYVVEGEKDVHALEAVGLTASCNPLGALQWIPPQAEALRGADVVVIPDNDRAGMVHSARVMATLRGVARTAALLRLPGAAAGEDVGDWLAHGGTAAELAQLGDAAPRDPSPAELASLLGLPPEIDPLASGAAEVRALLVGPPSAAPTVHPGFRRTAEAFARLRIDLRPSPDPVAPGAALTDRHPTYRAVTRVLRDAPPAAAPLLDDASLLDRSAYELGLFAALLRAAEEERGADSAGPADPDGPFATAPSVRVVRTRYDWEGFVGDPALAAPAEAGAAYLLHLAAEGLLQMRRLHPIPAILLEACARPCSRADAVAAVLERVDADPARLTALAHAQIDELRASGFLRPAPPSMDETVDEMLRLLPAVEPPRVGARGVVGMLARASGAVGEYLAAAAEAGEDAPYPRYLLDVSVNVLQEVLGRARVRDAFADE